ncbi:zinc finger, CCHC-type containing protein [Tanacetum coccineum]
MDESISVSSVIDKLPPSWKDFKHTLKHDSDKGKGKEVDGPSMNMTEEGKNKNNKQNKGKKHDFKEHGSGSGSNKKPKLECWKCGKTGHFKRDCRSGNKKNANAGGSRKGSKDHSQDQGQNLVDAIAWWIDSGAITHVCKDRCWFKTYKLVEDGSVLYMGDDHFAPVHGKGSVVLEFSSGKSITLFNVLYVPKLRFGYYNNGMFMLNLNKVPDDSDSVYMSYSAVVNSILWHARLGHVHYKRMLEMSKDELIPAIDENPDKCTTYEALDKFRIYKTEVELQQNDLIKTLRTDRGGEYYDPVFFQSVGIIHETTAPYTPQQNGVAERKNRALKEMVNSMLSYSGLSEGFWGEAMLTACYLLNRVPNKRNKTTPYELWYKKRPNLSFLRVWGCRAVVRLPDPKRKTLGEKGIDCIFVGYAEHSKAYRFYVIEPNDSVSINSIIELYESDKYILSKSGVFVGFGYYNNGMFMLNLNKVPNDSGSVYMSSSTIVNSSLWHARLEHVHHKRMLKISKDDLIPAIDENPKKYTTCMLTKITRQPFKSITRKSVILELIHSDLCDFHATPSLGNKKYGIIHGTTAPYTPQKNGVAKRKNRALKEMVNSMLPYSGLIEGLWGEAMLTTCYLLNRVPNKRKRLPHMNFGIRNDPCHICEFGVARAVVRLLDPKRKTLGEKGIDCIFVGYAEHYKAYRFYVIYDFVSINSIIKSRDAIFDENRFFSIPKPKDIIPNLVESQRDDHSDDVPNEGPEPRKDDDPRTYNEAMQSRDDAFWKEAINDEIGSIMKNNTWVLSDLPPGCKPLGCKWIFKRKVKVAGTIDKFKARLVIQGCRQKEGIDYFDTYAPIARITTIRLLLALATIHNLVIHQMDVKTTFLNGNLEEKVYMKQPEGFVMPGNEHKVCKLVKSLYGLKQAPKQWHQKFNEVVLLSGFLLNQSDKCVYSKFDSFGKGVIICLYVDDMLIFGTDQNQVEKTKKFLPLRFSMKDIGEADVILGIKIKRENKGIIITQYHYIEKILKKFNREDCSPISTPMDSVEKLKPNTEEAILINHIVTRRTKPTPALRVSNGLMIRAAGKLRQNLYCLRLTISICMLPDHGSYLTDILCKNIDILSLGLICLDYRESLNLILEYLYAQALRSLVSPPSCPKKTRLAGRLDSLELFIYHPIYLVRLRYRGLEIFDSAEMRLVNQHNTSLIPEN